MKKEEIAMKLRGWFDSGELLTINDLGDKYYSMLRKVAAGEYFCISGKRPIYSRNDGIISELNGLIGSGAVMFLKDVFERCPDIRTRYQADSTCANGLMIKLRIHGVVFYIRDADDK